MKRYIRFFKENITLKQALEVFNIDTVPSEEELKTMYKKLAIQNHPDKGGSVEKMKSINQAYDVLKVSKGGYSSSSSNYDWNEINAKWKAINERHFENMNKMFEESYNEKTVIDYLQQFTTDPLTIKTEAPDKSKIHKNTWTSYMFWVDATITIKNSDNTTYFVLQYSFRPVDSKGGLGSDDIDEMDVLYSVDVTTSVYHDHKKYKMGQRDYSWKRGRKALIEIDQVFPKVKMQKVFSGEKKGVFKKSDMLLGLKRELGATISDDKHIYIYPFGKGEYKYVPTNCYIYLMRSVMTFGRKDKYVSYDLYNFYALHPDTQKMHPFNLFIEGVDRHLKETPEDLKKLVDIVNEFKKEVVAKGLETEKPMKDSIAEFDILSKILKKYLPKKD
jgi:hypothetical protein